MAESTNNEPIIELRNVTKRFGALVVFDGIGLELEKGKTTVVIGESGVGKSVLLKHIVGLLRPDSGEVYFHGRRIDHRSEQELVEVRRHIGFLFQLGALFDSMTVAENVGFPVREHKPCGEAELSKIVREKLHMVGLDGLQDRRPGQLSGGQRKRVALARAIALDPEVVLYDEPTTGLDPARSAVINELIRKLQRELHVTSVVVTHDMSSAFKVGDRIVMIKGGKLIADGSAEWFKTCDNPVVRQFVEGKADPKDLEALELNDKKKKIRK